MTCEADRDFNSVVSLGKKRRKRQTIGDLQTLLEKYHDAKLNGNVVLGDEPNSDVICIYLIVEKTFFIGRKKQWIDDWAVYY